MEPHNQQLLDVLTREGVLINVSRPLLARMQEAPARGHRAEMPMMCPTGSSASAINGSCQRMPPPTSRLIEGRAHALIEATPSRSSTGSGISSPTRSSRRSPGSLETRSGILGGEGGVHHRVCQSPGRGACRVAADGENLVTDPDRLVATIDRGVPGVAGKALRVRHPVVPDRRARTARR